MQLIRRDQLSENFRTILKEFVFEMEIKKSRFITYLVPVESEGEVEEKLKIIRKEHHKANHHCSAFVIGEDFSIQRMSDDGEPSGTAGVPMLEVLKHHQLTNILAVVVRYFGGIKLGTGGLIRAYGNSVSEALKEAEIVANISQMRISLIIGYPSVDTFNYFLNKTEHPITILDTIYTDQVKYQLAVNIESVKTVEEELISLFNGQLTWKNVGEDTVYIPIKNKL